MKKWIVVIAICSHAAFSQTNTFPASGSVGVGTLSPLGKIDINHAGGQLRLSGGTVAGGVWTSAGDVLYLADWATGSKGLNINLTTGNVGIGTNPLSKLHINSAIERETLRVYKEGNSTNYLNIWQGTAGAAIDPIGTGLLFLGYDQPTSVIMGQGSGKIGIGTSSPVGKLDINGVNGQLRLSGAPTSAGIWTTSGNKLYLADWDTGTKGVNIELGSGNVGIGTTNPGTFKLAVEGKIGAREVNVTASAWADYVLKDGYRLRPLSEVQQFISENHHLPEVPSEKEVLANGQNLGEMNAILLKKIEELTLYILRQEERIQHLEAKANEKN